MLQAPLYWVNGEARDTLPLPDRGLLFGDGLFETLRWQSGRVQLQARHLQRLSRGCSSLGIPPPPIVQLECVLAAAGAALDASGACAAALRLTVTRAWTARGYGPGAPAPAQVLLAAEPVIPLQAPGMAPVHLGIAAITWSLQPRLAGLKHLNRLEQVLAAGEIPPDCDDVLMCDPAGLVISTSCANLFWRSGDMLYTPPLTECGIAGTVRALILEELAAVAGLNVYECAVALPQLLEADEVFTCNSLQGLRPVAQISQRRWDTTWACEQLRQAWFAHPEVMCAGD